MKHEKNAILLTGNAGFIGTYLARSLIQVGYEPMGVDLVRQKGEIDYPQLVGSILDSEVLLKALAGVDCVIHLAAEHKDVGISREKYFSVNEEGTMNLLRCASQRNVMRFIFFSSVAVYGEQQGRTEELSPNPATDYGSSKLAAERAVMRWAAEGTHRQAVILRPTVVFGPGNRANIFRLIKQVCDGRFVWVGDGNSVKSVAYVENLVDGTKFLLERMKPGIQVLNYADSPHMTTHELVSLIAQKASVKVPRLRIPLSVAKSLARGVDLLSLFTRQQFSLTSSRIVKFNTPTYHTAERLLAMGFKPRFSIEEGIERNVQWYMSQRESLMHHSDSSD